MASQPSMDAHFSPEAQGDMGYHDWDPCELYPQTEQSFDTHEESLDWIPGLTDVGNTAPHEPTFTLGNMSDDLIESGLPPPDRSRRWSFSQSEDPVGYEEEVLPPGFWRPNMLYETKAWWDR